MFPHQGFGIRDRNQKSLIGNLKSTRYDRAPFGVPLETRAGAQFYSEVSRLSGLFPSSMSRIAGEGGQFSESTKKNFTRLQFKIKVFFNFSKIFLNSSQFLRGGRPILRLNQDFTSLGEQRLLALEVQF